MRSVEIKYLAERTRDQMISRGELPDCRWARRELAADVGPTGQTVLLSSRIDDRPMHVVALALYAPDGRPVNPSEEDIRMGWYRLALAVMRP